MSQSSFWVTFFDYFPWFLFWSLISDIKIGAARRVPRGYFLRVFKLEPFWKAGFSVMRKDRVITVMTFILLRYGAVLRCGEGWVFSLF